MSKYNIQICTPDLLNKVRDYYIRNWGFHGHRLTTYLDWIHHQNPYFDAPLIYIALYEGRVVGMRAAIGTCWEGDSGREKLVLPNMTDSGIEPGHREGGLFRELSDFSIQDLEARGHRHILNLSPNPPNYVTSVMTLGWRPLGSSETMSRQAPSSAATRSILQAASRPGIAGRTLNFGTRAVRKIKSTLPRNVFSGLPRNIRHSSLPLTVSRQTRPAEMAELVRQIGGNGKIRHVRDEAYFAWRFLNPYFRYRFLFWGDERLDGYMVLQDPPGYRHVNIVQWEGLNPQIRTELLLAAINLGTFRSLELWGASLADADLEVLKSTGFTYTDDSPTQYKRQNFMIKPLAPKEENARIFGLDPLIHDNWDFQTVFYK